MGLVSPFDRCHSGFGPGGWGGCKSASGYEPPLADLFIFFFFLAKKPAPKKPQPRSQQLKSQRRSLQPKSLLPRKRRRGPRSKSPPPRKLRLKSEVERLFTKQSGSFRSQPPHGDQQCTLFNSLAFSVFISFSHCRLVCTVTQHSSGPPIAWPISHFKRPFPRWRRGLVQNHWYENEFYFQVNALHLVLKQRRRASWKWPIL